ncbi:MAG: UDP-2,4-diacetamido-2,4,6-trideoxy-beta-L-altropyranose hydrolase [Lachnospiraceae bacterium]|nr:UDP-2,4-diacetamido-2,4,6-trideoxy-beta-L-altropyranose hydrolase [Lachnospiraceae bacterium]
MEKEKKTIYIRTDGNAKIGMGHLTRCLSVADAIFKRDGDVCFLAAGEETAAIVRKAGFDCEVLGTDYRRMEEELPVLERLTGDEKCLFLVDSYHVTDAYLRTLRKWGKVAYLDDVNAFPYPVNLIINGNIYGAKMDYSACGANTEILGGPAYAPLKPQFKAHRGEREETYILVTTGGSDPYRLAEKIVGALLKEPWMEVEKICAVCGRFSLSIGALRELEKKEPRLRVLCDVPDMWPVMNGAKFAVTAAGGTMQELACLGVPMIGFSFADNQCLATRIWQEQGYSCYGGDYLSLGDEMIPEICAAAERLCGSSDLREMYSKKLMSLVDGEGSRRIAERLLHLQ